MWFIWHPKLPSEPDKFWENMFWWNTWDVTKRSMVPPLYPFEPKKKWNSDIHYYTTLERLSNKTIISNLMTLSKSQVLNELAWLACDAEIHYADVEYMKVYPKQNRSLMFI